MFSCRRMISRFIPSAKLVVNRTNGHILETYTCICIGQLPCHSQNIKTHRFFSEQATGLEMIVDYDYVKKATNNQNILLVDVREPDELKEHGIIPNSINIPLRNVSIELDKMDDKEFEQLYKKPKPRKDTEIVFFCMIGKRSGMAQQEALKLGFKKSKNYLGSWTDWKSKNQN